MRYIKAVMSVFAVLVLVGCAGIIQQSDSIHSDRQMEMRSGNVDELSLMIKSANQRWDKMDAKEKWKFCVEIKKQAKRANMEVVAVNCYHYSDTSKESKTIQNETAVAPNKEEWTRELADDLSGMYVIMTKLTLHLQNMNTKERKELCEKFSKQLEESTGFQITVNCEQSLDSQRKESGKLSEEVKEIGGFLDSAEDIMRTELLRDFESLGDEGKKDYCKRFTKWIEEKGSVSESLMAIHNKICNNE